MSAFTAVDLSKLAPPDIVETLDFEKILQAMKTDLHNRLPNLGEILESDPISKIVEVVAYRELLLRQRINEAARGVMLATAIGTNLDHLAAIFGIERQLLEPGDLEATPPVAPVYETDERLRQRTQLAIEGFNTAGSAGAYVFHALSVQYQDEVSGDIETVKDVNVVSPEPGVVKVTVLSEKGEGVPSAGLLSAMEKALNEKTIRPVTDFVQALPAPIQHYTVTANLLMLPGPGVEEIRAKAEQATREYTIARHQLGKDITLSGLYAALHQPGVTKVELSIPASDISISTTEAAFCDQITVTVTETEEE